MTKLYYCSRLQKISHGKNSLRVIALAVWKKLPNDLQMAPILIKGLIKLGMLLSITNTMSKIVEPEDL